MFGEIVAAGLVLMLVWWLFKSGLIWSILVAVIFGILFILFLINASAEGVSLGY
jgi:hypothetical protein